MKQTNLKYLVFAAVGVAMLAGPVAYAADKANSKLEQVIGAGSLSTEFRNSADDVVSTPTFTMGDLDVSNSQQEGTGTYGDDENRAFVDNPGGADGGWTLALNATNPGADKWTTGSLDYDYMGASPAVGQLAVNPDDATITPVIGGADGVSKGTLATFTSTSPITIMQADSSSANIWNGYITGVGLSQTIPASQPAGTYTLDMTQTVAAV